MGEVSTSPTEVPVKHIRQNIPPKLLGFYWQHWLLGKGQRSCDEQSDHDREQDEEVREGTKGAQRDGGRGRGYKSHV